MSTADSGKASGSGRGRRAVQDDSEDEQEEAVGEFQLLLSLGQTHVQRHYPMPRCRRGCGIAAFCHRDNSQRFSAAISPTIGNSKHNVCLGLGAVLVKTLRCLLVTSCGVAAGKTGALIGTLDSCNYLGWC